MKKITFNQVKIGMLVASFMFIFGASHGQYIATSSGAWSSTAVWQGGTAPPYTLGIGQTVTIDAGVNVVMDKNVTVDGILASITVDASGTLSADPHITLDVVSGTLAGAGTVSAATVVLATGGAFTFTGSLTADTLVNSIASLSLAAQTTVNNELTLPAIINIGTGGTLTLGSNSNITISGGGLALTGSGSVDLTSNYSVNYIGSSATTGLELSGSGLKNVTINVSNANNVSLGSNQIIADSLKFISGSLLLNGHTLTANGKISGNILIGGNSSSGLIINTSAGLSSPLEFISGAQNLKNLTVNVDSGDSVKISSPLTVEDSLVVSGSGNLSIKGEALTISGNVSGTGSIVTNDKTKLAFISSSSIKGNIKVTGSDVGNFTVDLGNDTSTVTLAAALTVDTLDLKKGNLALNKNNLSINGDLAANGAGTISATSSDNIWVTKSSSTTGSLMFLASKDSINKLTVNISGGGSLKLGSDLFIKDTLAFTNGHVYVADTNNLTIGTSGSITGAGSNTYVITGKGGRLTLYANTNNAITFEVGDTNNYLPAKITLNSGSVTGTIGLNVSSGVYSQGTSGTIISSYQPMVNATWLFQNNISSGLNANLQLSWAATAEVNGFVHTADYISHYISSAWDNTGDSMTATVSGSMYSVTRANITSMSPFAVFDKETITTGVNEIAELTDNIELYPNPTSGNLYIKNTTGGTGTVNVEIYNTLGQMVSNLQLANTTDMSIPVNALSSGIYIIKLYSDNMQVVKKFSKL